MDVEGRRDFWTAHPRRRRARPHGPVRHALPRGGRRLRRPDRAGQPRPGRRRRHRAPRSRPRLRPAGHAPPGRPSAPPRPPRCAPRPASRTSSCAATPCSSRAADSDAVARHLLTATAARDLRDHLARPRGRVPRPDRRRPHGVTRMSAVDRPSHRPAASRRWAGFIAHLPRHRDPPAAAQPPHRDLHADHAAGVLLLFGGEPTPTARVGGPGNVTAYVMISWRVYGAMIATTSGGAMVAVERAQGWTRQLRLTPLNPVAYIADQGRSSPWSSARCRWPSSSPSARVSGAPQMPAARLGRSPALRRLGRRPGLRRVRAVHGLPAAVGERHADPRPGAGAAGLRRRPVRAADQLGDTFQTSRKFTPAYGVGELARAPLTGDRVGTAARDRQRRRPGRRSSSPARLWRFRRDTARV